MGVVHSVCSKRKKDSNRPLSAPVEGSPEEQKQLADRDVEGLPSLTANLNFGQGTHTVKQDGGNEQDAASSLVPVKIYDGRADVKRFTLDEHGFALVELGDLLLNEEGDHLDLYDLDVAVDVLFPRVEEFVRQKLGATRVIAFDHILRNPERLAHEMAKVAEYEAAKAAKDMDNEGPPIQRQKSREECFQELVERTESTEQLAHMLLSSADTDQDDMEESVNVQYEKGETTSTSSTAIPDDCPPVTTKFLQGALANVHGDYTARSGISRAKQLLSPYISQAELERALSSRFQIVNFWHPFKLVQADPLALLTWRSSSSQHVKTNRMTFQHRVGETYKAKYSPDQRWVYFSGVRPDEAILLKPFDSLDDGHTARFCLHSAFELPEQAERHKDGRPPFPTRESTEVRLLVLYGEGLENMAPDFVAPHVDKKASTANELNGKTLLKKESLFFGDEW